MGTQLKSMKEFPPAVKNGARNAGAFRSAADGGAFDTLGSLKGTSEGATNARGGATSGAPQAYRHGRMNRADGAAAVADTRMNDK